MNWYVSQPIVCIKNHSRYYILEGQDHIIMALRQGCCCMMMYVGINNPFKDGMQTCSYCKRKFHGGKYFWFGEVLFAAKEEMTGAEEFVKELLLPQKELIEI